MAYYDLLQSLPECSKFEMNTDATSYEILRFVLIAVGSLYVFISILAGFLMLLKQEPLPDTRPITVDKAGRSDSSITPLIGRVKAIFGRKPYQKPTPNGKRPIPNRLWRKIETPSLPPALIPIPQDLIDQCDAVLITKHRLLLTGSSGMGKTTAAIVTCLRYKDLNGASPLGQLPVYLSLAQLGGKRNQYLQKRESRVKELGLEIIDSIGQNVRLKEEVVRGMLNEGNLFLIMDDLDYLLQESQNQLENFIEQFDKNSFICIVSEKPVSPSFLGDFQSVEVHGWDESTAKMYIKKRIDNPVRESQLLDELERFGVFQGTLTPLEADCLVNSYLKDPTHSTVLAPELNRPTKQRILFRYLALTLRKSQVHKDWTVRVFGRVALTQFVNERSYFLPVEAGTEISQLNELVPDLLKRNGAVYTFSHVQYQLMLASLFFDQFQKEAEMIIGNRPVDKFLWRNVPRDILVDSFEK